MDQILAYKIDIAFLVARAALGIMFLLQGYDKIFGLGINRTADAIYAEMLNTRLPKSLIRFAVVTSSVVELCGGLMLIGGLLVYPALMALGLDILLVIFAMSLRQPLWDMRYVWPRLVLILLLLLLPTGNDRISLDYFLNIYESANSLTGH